MKPFVKVKQTDATSPFLLVLAEQTPETRASTRATPTSSRHPCLLDASRPRAIGLLLTPRCAARASPIQRSSGTAPTSRSHQVRLWVRYAFDFVLSTSRLASFFISQRKPVQGDKSNFRIVYTVVPTATFFLGEGGGVTFCVNRASAEHRPLFLAVYRTCCPALCRDVSCTAGFMVRCGVPAQACCYKADSDVFCRRLDFSCNARRCSLHLRCGRPRILGPWLRSLGGGGRGCTSSEDSLQVVPANVNNFQG